MANDRHYIVTDTETSGLDPEKGHEIVQLCATAINCYSLEKHPAGTFSVLIKPLTPEKADPKAIEVIGKDLWERAQKEGIEPKVAYERFMKWAASINVEKNFWKKPMWVGFNLKFDFPFVTYMLKKHKLYPEDEFKLPWSFNYFDLYYILYALCETDPDVKNFKLDTLLSKLGLKRKNNTHSAEEDVELTAEAFVRTMKFFRKLSKRVTFVQ